jgi:hypothetical protein
MVITDSGVLTSGIAADAVTVVPIVIPPTIKRVGASLLVTIVVNMNAFETINKANAPPPKITPRSFTDSGRKRLLPRNSIAASAMYNISNAIATIASASSYSVVIWDCCAYLSLSTLQVLKG